MVAAQTMQFNGFDLPRSFPRLPTCMPPRLEAKISKFKSIRWPCLLTMGQQSNIKTNCYQFSPNNNKIDIMFPTNTMNTLPTLNIRQQRNCRVTSCESSSTAHVVSHSDSPVVGSTTNNAKRLVTKLPCASFHSCFVPSFSFSSVSFS